jgi:hypothetical protein
MAYSTKVSLSKGTLVNQNQGGGDKKAGFPYQVGRSSWSSIHIGDAPMTNGGYRKGRLSMVLTSYPNASKPIGNVSIPAQKSFGPRV